MSQAQQQKQQELLRSAVLEATTPKEPPPDYEFIADPPSISAFDLDVVSCSDIKHTCYPSFTPREFHHVILPLLLMNFINNFLY